MAELAAEAIHPIVRFDILWLYGKKNTMKTANVADLRNDFPKIAAWIYDGESVSIKRRGKLFATLTPVHGLSEPAMPKIDFAAQLKKIWGDKVFTDEEVREMRAAELKGEES
jgi:antitoxin (DNA-binding transcriptional repressor) of toxin-antitoxin stability system